MLVLKIFNVFNIKTSIKLSKSTSANIIISNRDLILNISLKLVIFENQLKT